MGRRAVGVDRCKRVGPQNAFDHIFAANAVALKRLCWHGCPRARQAAVAQVRKDAQISTPATDFFKAWCYCFGHAVDCIRAHGVAAVNDQVHYQHWAHGAGFEDAHFHIFCAAAQGHQAVALVIRQRDQFIAVSENIEARALWVGNIDQLDLANHQRFGSAGVKTAAFAH